MKKHIKQEYTYVLFGKEAVDLYNISLKLLLSSTTYVSYKAAAYNDVKRFMIEQKNGINSLKSPKSIIYI